MIFILYSDYLVNTRDGHNWKFPFSGKFPGPFFEKKINFKWRKLRQNTKLLYFMERNSEKTK